MIKETRVRKYCQVLEREVELSVGCYEDDRTGLKTPRKVEGCDATDECGVKVDSQIAWYRCPYIGQEARVRRSGLGH